MQQQPAPSASFPTSLIPPDKATPAQKKRAWHVVERALEQGLIKQERCENPKCRKFVTEAHHDDYAFPLQVRWLCRSHHLREHRSKK